MENPDTTPAGTHSCKFWGLGADGTVGANKNSIKIIGDHTDMYAQGYFAYDSKKSGGLTVSHLRFGKTPIKSTYYISKADFVACHNPSYVDKYEIVEDLKEGGSFLLNCGWDVEELGKRLPGKMKKILAERKINFYTIDAIKIGKEIGLGGRVNTVLQSAFFKIADIIPAEQAKEYMKDAAKKSYMKKGQAIVDMNYAAIDRGMEDVQKVEIPAEWINAVDDAAADKVAGEGALVEYVNGILKPVNAYKGNKLPVSAFSDHVDGTCPNGSAAFEKRGIAVDVPEWQSQNCIQCNRCAIVCPHAVIRPVALTADEAAAAPEGTKTIPMIGLKELQFAMTVSTLDCTGCGACAQVCPGKKGEKALVMKPIDTQRATQVVFDYGTTIDEKPEVAEKPPSRAASSSSPCSNSPAHAQAAARLPMRSSLPSSSVTECSSPTRPAAPPSGVHPLPQHLTPPTRRATVLLGRTPCSRTTQSSVSVWRSVRTRSATDSQAMLPRSRTRPTATR